MVGGGKVELVVSLIYRRSLFALNVRGLRARVKSVKETVVWYKYLLLVSCYCSPTVLESCSRIFWWVLSGWTVEIAGKFSLTCDQTHSLGDLTSTSTIFLEESSNNVVDEYFAG
jgi:hypothetical protein